MSVPFIPSVHHSIAIGVDAQAAEPYEFVVQVPIDSTGNPVRMSTIMTTEEYEVVYRVVRRVTESGLSYLELDRR